MGWGMDVIGGLVDGAQDVGGAIADGVGSATSATVDAFESGVGWVQDQLTPDIRPEGTNGHQIYAWFHHGPGTGSLDHAVDGWGRVSEHHVAVSNAVNSAMGKLRTSWEGQAAGSAIDASRPLRDAADTASKSARQAGQALSAQSFGFNEAKKGVVDVPSDPPMINPMTGGIGMISYHQQAQSYTADQQANQVALQSYGTQTGSNSGEVPTFDGASGGTKRDAGVAQPKPVAPVGGGFQDPAGSGSDSAYSGGSGRTDADTSALRKATYTGESVHAGGSDDSVPAGTGSSWYDGDSGLPQGGGFDFGTSHGLSGAGVAAGAAGLVASGGAVLGGGVLGESTGGRGGISGRGIAGLGSGTGGGKGGTATGGGRTPGGAVSGGRGGSAPLGGGRSGGVTPTTGSVGTATASRTGAPMAAGAAGRGQQGEDDEQHERPEWLTADESADELFGTDERTAPPVLGALPAEREDQQ